MRFFIPLVTLAVGFAAGWLISPKPVQPAVPEKETATSPVAQQPVVERVTEDGDISALLAEAFSSGRVDYASMRNLMRALAFLSSETLPQFTAFFGSESLRMPQIMLWQMFFSSWGAFDANGAIAFINSRFEEDPTRRLFYASILETWQNASIADAIDFAIENFQSDKLEFDTSLAVEYLRGLQKTDPDKALELAKRLHDGEFVFDLTGRRIADLVRKDRNLALDALDKLEGEMQIHAVSEFVAEWAKTDPAAAASWLGENFESRLGKHTLGQVTRSYASADPRGALQWIAGLADKQMSEALRAEAIKAWAGKDPAGAAAWLKEGGARTENDEAIVAFGTERSLKDPQNVIEEWVPLVSDPAKGNKLLYEVSLDWERQNPAEYAQWLENTTALSPGVRERLLARELPGDGETRVDASASGTSSAPLNQGRDDDGR